MDYIGLRKRVSDAGLLDRQYGYYAFKIFYTLAAFIGLIALLLSTQNFWLQVLVIVALSFVSVQVGLLGHDAAHLAIFRSAKWNKLAGLLFFGFFTGIGYNHWVFRHNAHHANPNHEGEDPDVASYAQTVEELASKRGIMKFIYDRQHRLFMVITAASVTAYQVHGLSYNWNMKSSFSKWADSLMMALHFAVFWVAPFFFFAWWNALIMLFLFRLLMGVYFGAVSATNHKGMRVVKKGEELGFVEKQVLTTRNVRKGRIVDFVYGGLNYQIEHHLFPTMPRVNFSKCKPVVEAFCKENGIPYEETGVVRSYRQILGALGKVVMDARRKKAAVLAAIPERAPLSVEESG